MKSGTFALAALLATSAAGLAHAADAKGEARADSATLARVLDQQGGAVFGGLDKITARVSTIYAPLDVPVRFGALSITVRQCKARPPEEPPEKAVFVEIDEAKPGKEPVHAFTGWMFWSSPALSALEHPVYDVWLVDCRLSAAERVAAAAAAAAQAAAQEEDEELAIEEPPVAAHEDEVEDTSEGGDIPLDMPLDVPR